MKIQIFAMTHKKFDVPPDPLYLPLHVGRALSGDLGYIGDDTGDNISAQNCYYSELTGFYWIWKNYHGADYVGTCHYRRYLINRQEKIFTRREYERLLGEYDLITTRRVQLTNSYYAGFSVNHNGKALDAVGEVIAERYPAYYPEFKRLVNGSETYFGNMLVTSKKLFDEYAEWLFSIFFAVADRIELETGEDAYHKRVFGFISEFLLLVWVRVKGLRVLECKVGMLGEKAETRETKERLAQYFLRRDNAGAKAYFLERIKERPDVMMEASDVTGELHLCMQVIATAEEEKKISGKCVLDLENDYTSLMRLFGGMNRVVSIYVGGALSKAAKDTSAKSGGDASEESGRDAFAKTAKDASAESCRDASAEAGKAVLTEADKAILSDKRLSARAWEIAVMLLGGDESRSDEQKRILERIYADGQTAGA